MLTTFNQIIHTTNILAVYIGRANSKLSEEDRNVLGIIILSSFAILLIWGIIVLIRYSFIKRLIKKKMSWSYTRDAFWNYEKIIEGSEKAYIKAQLFLNSTKYETLPFLTPHAKARLRLIKKRITSEHDLFFTNSYIVSFIDKVGHEFDEVNVYLEIKNKISNRTYKELLVLKREEKELIIKDIIRNPTIYMIAHARSIVKKT